MKIKRLLCLVLITLFLASCNREGTNITPDLPEIDSGSSSQTGSWSALWDMLKSSLSRDFVEEKDPKAETEEEILKLGVHLFSGGTNENYQPADVGFLRNASPDDVLALRFSFEEKKDETGLGEIILRFKTNDTVTKKTLRACADQPEKERLILVRVSEIEELIGTGIGDLIYFWIDTWKGGKIADLYFMQGDPAVQITEYVQKTSALNNIVHTYTGELSNKNASENARLVYAYLKGMNGKACLTGQMEANESNSDYFSFEYEVNYVEEATGRLPAIVGIDFRSNEFDRVVTRAKEWASLGGIPTVCWHTGTDFSSGYTKSVESELDWEKALTPGTSEYEALIAGMDRAAEALKKLNDADIPVLWRPFHEVCGAWFWWNRGGAENFKKLWQLMYTRYTEHWGLNNLIWVLGYCNRGGEMAEWYPGDEYVDIIGADSYDAGAHAELYRECREVAPEGMPIALHECGIIPTEQEILSEEAPWSYFMEWYTSLPKNYDDRQGELKEIYNSEYFITLDELPFAK